MLHGKTPYEMLHGQAPLYSHLKVFGCLCYAHNLGKKNDKFASRSRKCVFVGYPNGKKGWKLFDLDTQRHFVSHDVDFFETEFPFAHTSKERNISSVVSPVVFPLLVGDNDSRSHDQIDIEEEVSPDNGVDMGPTVRGRTNDSDNEASEYSNPNNPSVDPPTLDLVAHNNVEELGRGHRIRMPSVKLHDYVTHTVQKLSPSPSSPSPQHNSGAPYPLIHYVNYDKFFVKHRRFIAALTMEHEPVHFFEAVKDAKWRLAMQQELEALESNGTWTLQPLPDGKKPLGCKWVYKMKHNSDGTIERYKARLVILGNHQVEGIDYTETFAPVVKMVTVRLVLVIAAAKKWEIHQMDVHNAFLHGDLHEDVYMKLPPGFRTSQPGLVCKLRKSLYGLKQAPRCWFAKLSFALTNFGFQQSSSDHSLFTLLNHGVQLVVLVYVDDLIVCGNDSTTIQKFKVYLSKCFHMKDLGTLKYFLGVEVARNPSGIFLCQRKYTLDIIQETGLLGAKLVSTPLEQNHQLSLATRHLLDQPERYRRLVGRLIYLCFTRPELSYCVHLLSQFMQQPREEHWNAALRIVKYLKGSPGQGILLSSTAKFQLHGWCDSDWAGCPLTRRSTTGWFVFLGHSPISWKTKKQHTVSRSSAEAEYRSMATTTCELKWLKSLLSELGIFHKGPMRLHCDNQAALHIAQNPVFHERTKHIEVDCHFIRNEVLQGNVQPSYVPTSEQLADIFTKALGRHQFQILLGKLGIRNPQAPP